MSSIENVLQTLLSDKSVAETLSKQLSKIENPKEIGENTDAEENPQRNERLEQKINLINAVIPLLGEKNSQLAKFLIKLLTLVSIIDNMKQSQ